MMAPAGHGYSCSLWRAAIVLLFALAVGAFGAAGARAATRYAAPSAQGSGNCSSPTNSCTLSTAVSGSGQGDTVIVAGNEGTYGTASTPLATTIVDPAADAPGAIEGAPGQSRPVIYTDANPGLNVFGTSSVAGQQVATSVSDLDIEELASGLPTALEVSGNVDHTVVRSLNGAFQACEPFGLSPPQTEVISNSLCVAHNGNALGEATNGSPQTQSVTLRNDTLYATGLNARGIEYSIGGFTVSIAATNVIAHGDDFDVLANQFNGGGASITLDHSNYATVFQGGGATATLAGTDSNQTAAPKFINAAANDFHEAVGSPTIDAGATDPANGVTDLDGNPRTIGSSTDIGAYEAAEPPTTVAEPPTGIGTPQFTTPPQTTTPTLPGRVTFVSSRLLVRSSSAGVRLSCSAGSSGCRGTLLLSERVIMRKRSGHKRRSIVVVHTVGQTSFSIPSGQSATVVVKLKPTAQHTLLQSPRHRLTVLATARRLDGGAPANANITLTLTYKPRRHSHH